MKCLCCGKQINIIGAHWHKKCIQSFFESTKLPILDLKDINENVKDLANKYINENNSITGVQKKLSLHLSKEDGNLRLTVVGYPFGYIIKLNSTQFPFIAEAEHLVMSMADECKIKTAPHALIPIDNKLVYITKRIDRSKDRKIHMEDFCQLSARPTEYKYNGSYEKCAKIIDKYSSSPNADKIELFLRVCFCYMTGNSDMHLKNFSLIEKEDSINISPAYDLLPVKLLIEDSEELALTLNGKKKNITKNDFLEYALNIGIDTRTAKKLIDFLVSKENKLVEMINDSLIPEKSKILFIDYLTNKINILK